VLKKKKKWRGEIGGWGKKRQTPVRIQGGGKSGREKAGDGEVKRGRGRQETR